MSSAGGGLLAGPQEAARERGEQRDEGRFRRVTKASRGTGGGGFSPGRPVKQASARAACPPRAGRLPIGSLPGTVASFVRYPSWPSSSPSRWRWRLAVRDRARRAAPRAACPPPKSAPGGDAELVALFQPPLAGAKPRARSRSTTRRGCSTTSTARRPSSSSAASASSPRPRWPPPTAASSPATSTTWRARRRRVDLRPRNARPRQARRRLARGVTRADVAGVPPGPLLREAHRLRRQGRGRAARRSARPCAGKIHEEGFRAPAGAPARLHPPRGAQASATTTAAARAARSARGAPLRPRPPGAEARSSR